MSQLCDIVTVSAIAQIHTEIFTLDQNLPSRFVLPLRCPVVAPYAFCALVRPVSYQNHAEMQSLCAGSARERRDTDHTIIPYPNPCHSPLLARGIAELLHPSYLFKPI